MECVWVVFINALFEVQLLYGVQVHAFVLMPNHFHLLVTTPGEDLGIVMQRLIKSVTRTLNLLSGRSGRVFGARYHWTLVDSANYFACALKYVYRNPIRANICTRVEEYPYSTLSGLTGDATLPIQIHFPFGESGYWIVPEEITAQLEWLNRPFRKEYEEAIQKGLKKARFAPPMSKNSPVELKRDLI